MQPKVSTMRSPKRKPSSRPKRPRRPRPETHHYEADVPAGLEAVARREIAALLGKRVTLLRQARGDDRPGVVRFRYTGGLRALLRLNTVQTVHVVHHFDLPRPRALLGDEHFRALAAAVDAVPAVHPANAFATLHLSAAGEESPTLLRLREALAAHTGLTDDPDEGDLLLRLRRPPGGGEGWEVVIRISPRPLGTRAWRVCNLEGALNGPVAHAMTLMTSPRPHDVFLNLGCGSGTLAIERLRGGPARRVIGCDTDPAALACARENTAAAGFTDALDLHDWDMRDLPLAADGVDAVCADLPFGHLVGSHEENVQLYPQVLGEAARVAKAGALGVFITHEVRLMESLLAESAAWQTQGVLRVALGGLNPRIFVLRRR